MDSPLRYFFLASTAASSTRRVLFWLSRAFRALPKTGFDRCLSLLVSLWVAEVFWSHVTDSPTFLSLSFAMGNLFCFRHFGGALSRGSALGLRCWRSSSVAFPCLVASLVAVWWLASRIGVFRFWFASLTFLPWCCPSDNNQPLLLSRDLYKYVVCFRFYCFE